MKHLRIAFFLLTAAIASAQEKPVKDEKPKATPAPAPAAPASEAPRVATPTTASNDVPAQIAGIFFGLLQKGQTDAAYEGLTKNSKIAERPR